MKITVSAPDREITLQLDINDVMEIIHGTNVLGEELALRYLAYLDQGNPATVVLRLQTKVGSAALNRGIYRLWQMVRAAQGTLTVRGYPSEYVPSFTTLGLDRCPGMILEAS